MVISLAQYDAAIGFAERLTWFWSHHFCVSVAKLSRTVASPGGRGVREAPEVRSFLANGRRYFAATKKKSRRPGSEP
jgi:uncharacterized protein (DUF1800 family)